MQETGARERISGPLHIACAIAFAIDGLTHTIALFQGYPEGAAVSWLGLTPFVLWSIVCPISAVLVLLRKRLSLWAPALFPLVGGTILLVGVTFPGLHFFKKAPGDFHSPALPMLTPLVLILIVSASVASVSAIVLLMAEREQGGDD